MAALLDRRNPPYPPDLHTDFDKNHRDTRLILGIGVRQAMNTNAQILGVVDSVDTNLRNVSPTICQPQLERQPRSLPPSALRSRPPKSAFRASLLVYADAMQLLSSSISGIRIQAPVVHGARCH
ncbi:hypothetical protein C8J57DRAFT_1528264 [Mycena rebaudengoi]|nr:hypothetical protein C8J57DRAFT_1528264 [Mycena rebaudengoi]